jgi:glycosyltransferase involved in cell wall biosynthesis
LTKDIELVIPIYNDYESLEVLLQGIERVKNDNIKFLIINNGSSDPRIARILMITPRNCRAIAVSDNLGFGGGIIHGIKNSNSEWIGWMPGNLKINPEAIPAFLEKVEFVDNSIIKASRVGRTKIARLKTFFAGALQSLLLFENMFDTGGTPTICKRSFVLELRNPPLNYVFESFILFTARSRKMKVFRPEIKYGVRLFGDSHWQNGIKAEWNLMRLILISARDWR